MIEHVSHNKLLESGDKSSDRNDEDNFQRPVGDASDKKNALEFRKKGFKCDVCGKGFYKKQNLVFHLQMHTGKKQFECKTCHKIFPHPYNLHLHEQRHRSDKIYPCNECE